MNQSVWELHAAVFELARARGLRQFEVRYADTGDEIEIDLAEAPFFTIWSDLHPFICVEPCWGLPDHQKQEPFEKKIGIQVVPPQGSLSRGCSFRFR